MQKIKRFLYARRYFTAIIAFIAFYAYVVVGRCVPWSANATTFEFHALDFSVGFGSFIWPGQLYQWICGAPDKKTLTVYHIVLLSVFFIALALFLERLVKGMGKKDRAIALVIIVLFLTGPSTFSIAVTDLGFFEVYWMYLAALFFLCLAYRPLYFLVAPLCVLALMLNYAAIICYVPFFCIMLLYKYVMETSKSAKKMLLITFIVCVAVSIPTFIYLVLFTQRNTTYTFDEFNALMHARGVREFTYIDVLFYGREKGGYPEAFNETWFNSTFYTPGENLTVFQELLNFVELRFTLVLYFLWLRNPSRVILPLLVLLPVIALIFGFCFAEIIKKQNSKLRRFVFFCMPTLFIATILLSLGASHDTFKWLDFAFLPLFASFLYVLYREPENVIPFVRRFISPFTAPQIGMYAVMYSFCVFNAYF